ncbi:unnamed protein product [Didymodactylos carnosus]|uniref:Uncharacterized protein n=1 Tax=Didymodactylos carnosus TaxID=1234261 RepID=A0A814CP91_9BILA|nr:unnamed protein product [Didymodactylos carnosus]CAF1056133.1 unnamed protein product [Didymodactylos carnosus]CAF3721175.1 unnamed protein product [Didymodactylos carnosus]CAF3822322.1 unnamed protein product [Didymodactylos carnosus]
MKSDHAIRKTEMVTFFMPHPLVYLTRRLMPKVKVALQCLGCDLQLDTKKDHNVNTNVNRAKKRCYLCPAKPGRKSLLAAIRKRRADDQQIDEEFTSEESDSEGYDIDLMRKRNDSDVDDEDGDGTVDQSGTDLDDLIKSDDNKNDQSAETSESIEEKKRSYDESEDETSSSSSDDD